jgi:hypothetical protein
MSNVVYNNLKNFITSSSINFLEDDIGVLLVQETNPNIVTSAIYVSATLEPSFSGSDIRPLTETSGIGYTSGGVSLSGVSALSNEDISYITAGDITWYNSTITAGGCLIYKGTVNNYLQGKPLAYIDFVVNRASKNTPFTLQWNSAGIIQIG